MFWYFRVVFSGFNTCILGFCALVTMLVILLTVLSDRLIRSDLDIVWNYFDLRISCPRWTTRSGTGGRLLSISGPTVGPVKSNTAGLIMLLHISCLHFTGSPAVAYVLLDLFLIG